MMPDPRVSRAVHSETPSSEHAHVPELRDIAPGVAVLDPGAGADTMAVLGAMMSRTGDLRQRWARLVADAQQEADARGEPLRWDYQNPPERIQAFLKANLAGYSHASIGSMAKSVFLFLSGFGWPGAWLLEDTPLFDGQEVSTRAVRGELTLGADGPGTVCRYAPPGLEELHAKWLAAYAAVADQAKGGGWKFDDARLLLPGTIGSGVVWTNDVRTIARLLDHIQGLGGPWTALAGQGYTGLDAVAPLTSAALARKKRPALQHWRVRPTVVTEAERAALVTDPGAGTVLRLADEAPLSRWTELLDETTPRSAPSQHLDPLWKRAPRFELRMRTTVAVARDWHRHRPVMPWTLAPCVDHQGDLVFAPWSQALDAVGALRADTNTVFRRLLSDAGDDRAAQWQALHALPFGALVEIRCVGTLPDLLYMLELRYTVQGANPEYRRQAESALEQLGAIVPAAVVTREHLTGVLAPKDGGAYQHPV